MKNFIIKSKIDKNLNINKLSMIRWVSLKRFINKINNNYILNLYSLNLYVDQYNVLF